MTSTDTSNPSPIRPFGLLIYRKGELDKTEILVQIKDGKFFVPSVLLREDEEPVDAAARLATEELGIDSRDLLVNPLTTGTSDHPDFRYTLMVATPRAELSAKVKSRGNNGGQTALKWEALDALDEVTLYAELRASNNAIGLPISRMDEPDMVLDPKSKCKAKSRSSSRRRSTFRCF
ncbi:hypothetical protein F5X99DRAFT_406004 [Biscogniauxia marginata]|nr:hypothetical protein F5X99DRAFT_406004 [Biscogniauxia marginata]